MAIVRRLRSCRLFKTAQTRPSSEVRAVTDEASPRSRDARCTGEGSARRGSSALSRPARSDYAGSRIKRGVTTRRRRRCPRRGAQTVPQPQDDNQSVATVTPAEGIILNRIREAHLISPEGLSREAYARFDAAQIKTAWGGRRVTALP
jgi:hypothetical protein